MSDRIKQLLKDLAARQEQQTDEFNNDPVIQSIKPKVDAAKEELAANLVESVKRAYDLAPDSIKPYIHHKMIITSMMEGIYNDICVKVMDQLDPDWENKHYPTPEEIMVQILQDTIMDKQAAASNVDEPSITDEKPEDVTVH